jgi:hypothetical protein
MKNGMSPSLSPRAALWPLAAAVLLAAAGCGRQPAPAPAPPPAVQAPAKPPAPQPPRTIALPKDVPMAARFTLMNEAPLSGRSSPISSNYRPQFSFAGHPDDLTCTVTLPASTPELAPGQSADATLTCGADVQMDSTRLEFEVREGGKKVGFGSVRVP